MVAANDTISTDALLEVLGRFAENQERLLEALNSRSILPRFMTLVEAEKYCGFFNAKSPDKNHRRFKRFLKEEGLKGKKVGASFMFKVSELDRVMTSQLQHVTSTR